MMYKTGIWMLLVACGATLEMYDDNHVVGIDKDEDIEYNEESYNYIDPARYGPGLQVDPINDLMLYQLFNWLQNREDGQVRLHYRPKLNMAENPLASFIHIPYPGLMSLNSAVVKRPMDAPSNASSNINAYKKRPIGTQPKWKGKKVTKVGSQMVCYFKLCAFRPPV